MNEKPDKFQLTVRVEIAKVYDSGGWTGTCRA